MRNLGETFRYVREFPARKIHEQRVNRFSAELNRVLFQALQKEGIPFTPESFQAEVRRVGLVRVKGSRTIKDAVLDEFQSRLDSSRMREELIPYTDQLPYVSTAGALWGYFKYLHDPFNKGISTHDIQGKIGSILPFTQHNQDTLFSLSQMLKETNILHTREVRKEPILYVTSYADDLIRLQ